MAGSHPDLAVARHRLTYRKWGRYCPCEICRVCGPAWRAPVMPAMVGQLTALAGLAGHCPRGVLVRPHRKLAPLAGAEHPQRLGVVFEREAVADHRLRLDRARLEHRYRPPERV